MRETTIGISKKKNRLKKRDAHTLADKSRRRRVQGCVFLSVKKNEC